MTSFRILWISAHSMLFNIFKELLILILSSQSHSLSSRFVHPFSQRDGKGSNCFLPTSFLLIFIFYCQMSLQRTLPLRGCKCNRFLPTAKQFRIFLFTLACYLKRTVDKDTFTPIKNNKRHTLKTTKNLVC